MASGSLPSAHCCGLSSRGGASKRDKKLEKEREIMCVCVGRSGRWAKGKGKVPQKAGGRRE